MFTNATANRANLSYSQVLPNTTPLLFRPLLFVWLLSISLQQNNNSHPTGLLQIWTPFSQISVSRRQSLAVSPFSRLRRHAQADTSLDCRARRFSLCQLGALNFSHWLACLNLVDGEQISYADSWYAVNIYIYIYIYIYIFIYLFIYLYNYNC